MRLGALGSTSRAPWKLEGRWELSRSLAGVSKANPRNIAINQCALAGAQGSPATPAGVRIVVPLLPGARFAHPRLISFRPLGAEYVTLFMKRDSHLLITPDAVLMVPL